MTTSTMIPKDLLPMIGSYIRPKLYKFSWGSDDYSDQSVNIYADSKKEVYSRLCDAESRELLEEILKDVCDTHRICLVMEDEPPCSEVLQFILFYKRWFKHEEKHHVQWSEGTSETTACWEITCRNLRKHGINEHDLKRLFELLNDTDIKIVQVKVH
jgi:hypothetical protein